MDLDELPGVAFLFQDTGEAHCKCLRVALPFEGPHLAGVEPGCRVPFLDVVVLGFNREVGSAFRVMTIVVGDT